MDPGPALSHAIEQRTRTMLSSGWQEEVRMLMRTVPEDAPAWNATGYRAVRSLERGEIDVAETERRIIIETRQYAKRQRTWFRHQLEGEDVTRFRSDEADYAGRLTAWWRNERE